MNCTGDNSYSRDAVAIVDLLRALWAAMADAGEVALLRPQTSATAGGCQPPGHEVGRQEMHGEAPMQGSLLDPGDPRVVRRRG